MSNLTPVAIVTVERRGDALIATVNAKMLEEKELKSLAAIIDETASGTGLTKIVVNLERVQLVPSLGLGVLLRMAQKCTSRQQVLLLAGLIPKVRQIFTITKLDRVLQLTDNVESALSH